MNLNNLESILLVTSKDPENHRFGTGFVIRHFEKSSWIVTCAHVVNDVGGEILLEVNGNPAKIVGTSASDDLDLSLIEADGLIDLPIVKLGTYGRTGSPFTTAGFQLFGKHFSIKRVVGKLAQLNELVAKSLSERIKVWTITMLGDDTLQDGYSGAPVIDDESGFCVGVISYKQGDGKNGLAISIDELQKILPKGYPSLFGMPTRSHGDNTHADYLFEKATHMQIMGELHESLELFQRVKDINPTYPRINMMIDIVNGELRRGYVEHGHVIPDKVLERQPVEALSRPPYPAPARKPRSSFWLIGCIVIVIGFLVITLAILGYFMLRRMLGF